MAAYDLTVRAGTSIDSLQTIDINNDAKPYIINSDHFKGEIIVRIKGRGKTQSPYFQQQDQDTFCIAISGQFKKENLTANNVVFGNQFDAPLRLPTGSSIAVKFAKWFDPGLEADLASDRPFAFSPLVVTMNRLNVSCLSGERRGLSSEPIKESMTLINPEITTEKQRRHFYTTPKNREQVLITPDQVWSMDFCNPYLDFEKCTVRIPGFEVDILRYWDGQPARFIAKSKEDGTIFFIIEFNLSPKEEDLDID